MGSYVKTKGPKLPDVKLFIQAGIDFKTRLPSKVVNPACALPNLKENAKKIFRIIDEQRAVNRYKWTNLPPGLNSQELERLLYYKGQLAFFYYKELDKFFFMPFALDGSIDFYARYNTIHPVPFTSGKEDEKTKIYKEQLALLSMKKLTVVKDVVIFKEEITEDLLTNSAVILRDYTNQLPQLIVPRYLLNDDLTEMQAECLCFLRTNLIVNTGVKGLRVPDADAYAEADSAAAKFYTSAVSGNPYTAITSKVEFQDLQNESAYKASEYFLSLQSIDNLLLQTYGIENSGIYEKKAHINESEYAVNATNISLVAQDGLTQRQMFCNIVNSIWNGGMWCELSETVSGADINADGISYDENNGTPNASDPGLQETGGDE